MIEAEREERLAGVQSTASPGARSEVSGGHQSAASPVARSEDVSRCNGLARPSDGFSAGPLRDERSQPKHGTSIEASESEPNLPASRGAPVREYAPA